MAKSEFLSFFFLPQLQSLLYTYYVAYTTNQHVNIWDLAFQIDDLALSTATLEVDEGVWVITGSLRMCWNQNIFV